MIFAVHEGPEVGVNVRLVGSVRGTAGTAAEKQADRDDQYVRADLPPQGFIRLACDLDPETAAMAWLRLGAVPSCYYPDSHLADTEMPGKRESPEN